eukprot:198827_1
MVNIFGTEEKKGTIHTFYHGISQKMLFYSTSAKHYGAFSTTASWAVAVTFSGSRGLVLELNADLHVKYFSCPWLSDFPAETECLFIGAGSCGNLSFVNVTDTMSSTQYKKFIKAITVIERMTNNVLFSENKIIQTKMIQQKHINPQSAGAQKLDEVTKDILIKLIKNQLKIESFHDLHPYIRDLFHNICLKKHGLKMNMNYMDIEISDVYEDGYIGYKFLKNIFCNDKYGSVNLDFVNKLYPNLTSIHVEGCLLIHPLLLDDILKLLIRNNATKIVAIYFWEKKNGISFAENRLKQTIEKF